MSKRRALGSNSIMPNHSRKLFGMGVLACCWLLCSQAAFAQDAEESDDEQPAAVFSALSLDDLRTFTDVFNQVRKNYVENVDDKQLMEAAITGMLSELDPHSAYLPGDDYADLDHNSRGEYVGIGVDVIADNGRVVVRKVIVPSPADSAGINPGDVFTSIAGKVVKGRKLQEAINDLGGPAGSEIQIKVLNSDGESTTKLLKREVLKVPALNARLFADGLAYFSLSYFHRESAKDLQASIESIQAEGNPVNGVVLDLRNNPGGVLQSAVDIADGFLDDGLIASMRGRNASMEMEFTATGGQWFPNTPVVVLVDRGSASASEVVAGALQDHGRALILGERTFGKGSVQTVLPLRNGGGIKLTTARYFTPSGRSIQAEGIMPDLAVQQAMNPVQLKDDRLREADLERHLESRGDNKDVAAEETVHPDEDFPLYEALRLLRGANLLSRKADMN
ncbi:MAG: S41 family peptidase [Xanthomonadales bacterium]|nr:S41 family peptidase [Xanthomonadales bacterium]